MNGLLSRREQERMSGWNVLIAMESKAGFYIILSQTLKNTVAGGNVVAETN